MRYDPARLPESEEVFQETEWFADDGGVVIGLIAIDKADKDWFIGVWDAMNVAPSARLTWRAVSKISMTPGSN